MRKTIALFRGINVGGKNTLPMKELRKILTNLGAKDVETYIQSGNVVFCNATKVDAKDIQKTVKSSFKFSPTTMLLSQKELSDAIKNNPFPNATNESNTLHFFFCDETPSHSKLDIISALKRESESYSLVGNVFYLHAPEGIGRSKLAAQVEKHLGVPTTARNWRTVNKLAEMVQGTC